MAKRSKSSRRIVGKKGKGKVASSPHPWRLCPLGEHWVVSHPMHVPPSANNPDGSVVTRHGHCHSNPSGKDSIYSDEITEIANKHFTDLVGAPTPDDLGFKHGNDFDSLIRGWTKYWNEVLNPKELLDPNIVKALIATESGFRPDIIVKVGKTKNRARGLMQVTDESQKILGDPNGELKDHLVHVDQNEILDPNLNISAGIRWLFRKKQIADSLAGRELTWLEAVQKYKAEKVGNKLINRVIQYYDRLKKGKDGSQANSPE